MFPLKDNIPQCVCSGIFSLKEDQYHHYSRTSDIFGYMDDQSSNHTKLFPASYFSLTFLIFLMQMNFLKKKKQIASENVVLKLYTIEHFSSLMNLCDFIFLNMFSGFSFKLILYPEKGTVFNQISRIPSIRPCTGDPFNRALLKRNVMTSTQKLSSLSIHTGIRALTTTK